MGRLEKTRKVKEGKYNEGRRRDKRLMEVKFNFKVVAKSKALKLQRGSHPSKAIEAKARLSQVHEDLILLGSGHQVQASSNSDEKVSKDKLKHPRLHPISRIK